MYQQRFIELMKEHLYFNNFPYYVGGEEEYYTRVIYDVDQQVIHIESGQYEDPSPLKLGVTLAQLHYASSQFPLATEFEELVHFGKWTTHWYEDMQRIQKYYNHLHNQGTSSKFDEEFLKNYTYFNQLAQVALYYLEDHNYEEFIEKHPHLSVLTYSAFSWMDVEYTRNQFYFTNPHEWILDLAVRDLAEFIRYRSMHRYDYEEVIPFLYGYHQERKLFPTEFQLMYARLLYPNEWVQFILRYLQRKEDFQMDSVKELNRIVHVQQAWERVLADFVKMIDKEFGVTLKKVDWLHHQ